MKPENEYNERQEQQKTPETQERMSLKNKKIKHGHAGNTGAENNELFASMPVAQAILMLAVPTVVSQIITIIYNMADTFFIGQLGDPKQVAAATLAMPLFMFMTALSNLFGVGGASLISRFLGAKERDQARRCSAFCIWSAAAVSFLYGVLVLAGRPVLMPLLGANEETFQMASSYLFWTIGLGAFPTVLNPALAHLIRAEGYSRQASFGVAFGGILNMVLDPLFIYGFHLQITGAAIATLISNTTALLYFVGFIWKIHRRATFITKILYVRKPYSGRGSQRGFAKLSDFNDGNGFEHGPESYHCRVFQCGSGRHGDCEKGEYAGLCGCTGDYTGNLATYRLQL